MGFTPWPLTSEVWLVKSPPRFWMGGGRVGVQLLTGAKVMPKNHRLSSQAPHLRR